ncbi:hypothetical protein AvCA_43700 [Azotobacter vinelandii CA]|uniref:Uncharacterized protein n=2 Tax=Azotobacter vinelandii TaxID=354 RepID=C1DGJ5_AZOVD|nr:hypothetical protein Avin_43700 [Azotobacter vinelandii DJ]AGK14384.1 hypothetical protein AvCA_43700 [Azotobacter vinelandii CA]AGK21948.1 hypothetical protein AvCA6_43700 [Azotobacter vinelandii CA6]
MSTCTGKAGAPAGAGGWVEQEQVACQPRGARISGAGRTATAGGLLRWRQSVRMLLPDAHSPLPDPLPQAGEGEGPRCRWGEVHLDARIVGATLHAPLSPWERGRG